jgi:hypothetical protein
MEERGYVLGNIDCTIIAQKPKLSPHKVRLRWLCAGSGLGRLNHMEGQNQPSEVHTQPCWDTDQFPSRVRFLLSEQSQSQP